VLSGVVLKPLAPDWLRQVRRRLRRQLPTPAPQRYAIRPEFARRVGLDDRLEALWAERAKPWRSERQDHWRRLTWPLIPFVFETSNRTASAFGIEPRYPFYDRRLVEFCLALPGEQKLKNGWTRMIERRGLGDLYPPQVRWRLGKSDLGANFHRGLTGPDRPLIESLLAEPPPALDRFVDVRALSDAYARYVAGPSTRGALEVWPAISLAVWLRESDDVLTD
jgi:asparagine synthase (glutamine-hydrolysing)